MTRSLPEELEFFKMAGTGNDFILIDNRRAALNAESFPELARLLCRRQFSVGADGLIVLETTPNASVRMHYFNADGSRAQLCGNGARCAARLAYMRVIAGRSLTLETDVGILQAEVLEKGEVKVSLPAPANERLNVEVEFVGHTLCGQYLEVGVPHVVFFLKEIDNIDVMAVGRAVRSHPAFAPEGANVHFAETTSLGLRLRSYERGVEAEVLACGSGAAAAACLSARLFGTAAPVPVYTRGGALLTIHFNLDEDGSPENLALQGETRLVCRGKITAEALAS